jgi:ABC-type multidrug transport system ATPase subunit
MLYVMRSEPTSGLDAATSVSVVHALHDLAHLGMNVVATLHQPRQEILNLMHKLILLGPGGRIVYGGPVLKLADHFSKLGTEKYCFSST